MDGSRYVAFLHRSLTEGTRNGRLAMSGAAKRMAFAGDILRKVGPYSRHAGQGLVEYSLILVLVAIVVIGNLSYLGTQVNDVFEDVNCRISGGTIHTDNGNGNRTRCTLPNGNGHGPP